MRCNLMLISKECAKGLLLALNIFCMLLAIFMFSFAVVDSRILKQYGEDQAVGTFAGDMVIIITCLMLVAVAVLGCVGCIRESVRVLYLYVGLLLILVLIEILVGIFVAVQRCGLQLRVTDWLRTDFYRNTTGDELEIHSKVWDELQTDYQCCGLNGPEDYLVMQQPISLACCAHAYRARSAMAQRQLYKMCIESGTYFHVGCEEEVLEVLRSDADYLLGMASVSFWFEASGVLLAMWIANNLKNSVKIYKHTVKY